MQALIILIYVTNRSVEKNLIRSDLQCSFSCNEVTKEKKKNKKFYEYLLRPRYVE